MTKFARVKEGNQFVITDLGMQIAHVNSKYEDGKKQYKKCVPQIWIDNGWVKEVKDGEK